MPFECHNTFTDSSAALLYLYLNRKYTNSAIWKAKN